MSSTDFLMTRLREAESEVQRQIDDLLKLQEEERRDYGPHVNTKAFNIAAWRRVGLEDALRLFQSALDDGPSKKRA